MRKMFLLSTCVLLGSALVGCGGSPCDKAADAVDQLIEKGGECLTAELRAQLKASADLEACEKAYDEATDEEKKDGEAAINDLAECVDKLDECTEATADEWGADLNACFE